MRFGFVTCVQLGLSCMEAIYGVGGKLDLAISLHDDMARAKSGRVYLDDFCRAKGVNLIKIRDINHPDAVAAIRERAIDWLFIIGWSQVARRDVLDAPRKGAIGMHPTLLPVGRGRAAIPWAILKGLDRTGVTMFQLDHGVDTGPIIAQREITLTAFTDATKLYHEVEKTHVRLMRDVFSQLSEGLIEPRPQDEALATVWPGRRPEDGRIDLSGSVHEAERLVRAVTRPYPGAFVDWGDERLIIWRAEKFSGGRQPSNQQPVLEFGDGLLLASEWEIVPPRS